MKRVLIIAITLLATMATSCSIYRPQASDIPLINHRGDLHVDGNLALSAFVVIPMNASANLTATYGLTDWLAVQGYLSSDNGGGMGHLAVGAYYPVPDSKFVIEGYLGAGRGYSANHTSIQSRYNPGGDTATSPSLGTKNDVDPDYSYYQYGGHYSTYFVQANMGWAELAKGHIDIGFGLRQGLLDPDFASRSVRTNDNGTTTTSDHRYTTVVPYTEPQLMFRAGGKKLKFTLKLGFLFMSRAEFVHDNFSLSVGLNYRL
ncbi:MAG: hypothetical protein IJ789_08475 [Bacteroidales bacterium]|nr:hypothetical protein [Bacteroidales bacterium]